MKTLPLLLAIVLYAFNVLGQATSKLHCAELILVDGKVQVYLTQEGIQLLGDYLKAERGRTASLIKALKLPNYRFHRFLKGNMGVFEPTFETLLNILPKTLATQLQVSKEPHFPELNTLDELPNTIVWNPAFRRLFRSYRQSFIRKTRTESVERLIADRNIRNLANGRVLASSKDLLTSLIRDFAIPERIALRTLSPQLHCLNDPSCCHEHVQELSFTKYRALTYSNRELLFDDIVVLIGLSNADDDSLYRAWAQNELAERIRGYFIQYHDFPLGKLESQDIQTIDKYVQFTLSQLEKLDISLPTEKLLEQIRFAANPTPLPESIVDEVLPLLDSAEPVRPPKVDWIHKRSQMNDSTIGMVTKLLPEEIRLSNAAFDLLNKAQVEQQLTLDALTKTTGITKRRWLFARTNRSMVAKSSELVTLISLLDLPLFPTLRQSFNIGSFQPDGTFSGLENIPVSAEFRALLDNHMKELGLNHFQLDRTAGVSRNFTQRFFYNQHDAYDSTSVAKLVSTLKVKPGIATVLISAPFIASPETEPHICRKSYIADPANPPDGFAPVIDYFEPQLVLRDLIWLRMRLSMAEPSQQLQLRREIELRVRPILQKTILSQLNTPKEKRLALVLDKSIQTLIKDWEQKALFFEGISQEIKDAAIIAINEGNTYPDKYFEPPPFRYH